SSPNGPRTENCGNQLSSACATTSRRRRCIASARAFSSGRRSFDGANADVRRGAARGNRGERRRRRAAPRWKAASGVEPEQALLPEIEDHERRLDAVLRRGVAALASVDQRSSARSQAVSGWNRRSVVLSTERESEIP